MHGVQRGLSELRQIERVWLLCPEALPARKTGATTTSSFPTLTGRTHLGNG